MLSQRGEHHGMRRTAGAHVLGVAHDAYDFKGRAVLRYVQAEMFPDGILVREELFGEGLIHYSDTARGAGVFFADAPSAQNRLAHGFKVSGAHAIPGCVGFVIQLGHAVAFGNDGFTPIINVGGIECQRGALYSGNLRQAALQLAVERVELGLGVTGRRFIHHNADAVIGLEAKALMLEIAQAAGQQTCAREQDDGERGLHYDQDFLRQRSAVAGAAIGPAQSLNRVAVGGEPCRRRAKQHSRQERQAKGESQHRERWVGIDGNKLRTMEGERDHQLYAEVGNRNSGYATEHGEYDALCERLLNKPIPRCAQSQPHRGLRTARSPAGQQQVGYIGAGNQQHQAADGEQDVKAIAIIGFHRLHARTAGNNLDLLLGQGLHDHGHKLGRPSAVVDHPLPQNPGKPRGNAAVLAPGFSLPITRSHPEMDCLSREFCAFTKGSCCKGSHSSGGLLRSVSPKKPGGAMPAMVKGCPFTIKVDPTT